MIFLTETAPSPTNSQNHVFNYFFLTDFPRESGICSTWRLLNLNQTLYQWYLNMSKILRRNENCHSGLKIVWTSFIETDLEALEGLGLELLYKLQENLNSGKITGNEFVSWKSSIMFFWTKTKKIYKRNRKLYIGKKSLR